MRSEKNRGDDGRRREKVRRLRKRRWERDEKR